MPVTLRAATQVPCPDGGRAGAVQSRVAGRPLLRYDYRLPAGMASLPTDNPCLRYEFGSCAGSRRLGQPEPVWQGEGHRGQLPHPAGRLPPRPGARACSKIDLPIQLGIDPASARTTVEPDR